MSHSFDNILIIGGGLIGSSLARAVRAYDIAKQIFISDISTSTLAVLKDLGVGDRHDTQWENFAADADLIMLCVPPAKLSTLAHAVLPHMKSGAVLSDVGSVKGEFIKAVQDNLRDDISFIPGHPIAGTENSGPEAGFAELFQDRWCVLTPADFEHKDVIRLQSFWESMGSKVTLMDPARHDIVLATTSHIPHLIAFTLVGTALDMETVTRNEVVKFSAGGFRDFTRIAASDPAMWRDVFLNNREAVLEVVDRFIEDLSALKRSIRWDDGESLLSHFTRTRDIRRRIIDAGQENPEPNFGRNIQNPEDGKDI